MNKLCKKCLAVKDLSLFYINKDKVSSSCKECKKQYSKDRILKVKNDPSFKDKRKDYSAKYYLINKEIILNKTSKYYHNNKEYYILQNKIY